MATFLRCASVAHDFSTLKYPKVYPIQFHEIFQKKGQFLIVHKDWSNSARLVMRSSHERIFWEFGHVFLLVDKSERNIGGETNFSRATRFNSTHEDHSPNRFLNCCLH